MEYARIKDPDRLSRLKEQFAAHTGGRPGTTIRYVMPGIQDVFVEMGRFITEHREQFFDQYYLISSDARFIRKLIPAPEYYKTAFRSINDKLFLMNLCSERMNHQTDLLAKSYLTTRQVLPGTGQPSVNLETEVYMIRADLASFFFAGRSALDTVATLTNFLYGPTGKLFSSFKDFYKHIRSGSTGIESMRDPALQAYFQTEMQWFDLLTDFRDYVTHFSSLEISLVEIQPGSIRVYIEYGYELTDVVNQIIRGIWDFLKFFDKNMAGRLAR